MNGGGEQKRGELVVRKRRGQGGVRQVAVMRAPIASERLEAQRGKDDEGGMQCSLKHSKARQR